jgi:hypothetical protein
MWLLLWWKPVITASNISRVLLLWWKPAINASNMSPVLPLWWKSVITSTCFALLVEADDYW